MSSKRLSAREREQHRRKGSQRGRSSGAPVVVGVSWHKSSDVSAEKTARELVSILKSQPQPDSATRRALVAGRNHAEKLAQSSEPISYKEAGLFLESPLAYFDGTIGGRR